MPNPINWVDPLGLSACPPDDDRKRMSVGDAGHHVPSVRKSRGRSFEIKRSDKNWPTFHFRGEDPGYDHWRLHDMERQHISPRQGHFSGSDQELIDAYKKSYEGLNDIRIDVRSPNHKIYLAKMLYRMMIL